MHVLSELLKVNTIRPLSKSHNKHDRKYRKYRKRQIRDLREIRGDFNNNDDNKNQQLPTESYGEADRLTEWEIRTPSVGKEYNLTTMKIN